MKKTLLILLSLVLVSCNSDDSSNQDNIAPIITLLGDEIINITIGDTYIDAGATALDNIDGDITANIITTGNVNSLVNGTYTLTYNVNDAAGNAAEQKTRTVYVAVDSEILYTYVPDDGFEQRLIGLGYDDVLDDYVITNNINTLTDLDISQFNIQDLTGIEDFTSLEILNCSVNQISNTEAINSLNLKWLKCSGNLISNIDVSNFTSLEYLNCDWNEITTLDVTQNILLKQFYCSFNLISTLDLSSNTALVNLSFATNNFTEIDFSNNINLETLHFSYNNISSLDLSNNPLIKEVSCSSNQIQSLDLSQLSLIKSLNFNNNQIQTLIIPPNNTLEYLGCSNNHITTLDLSQSTVLINVLAQSNELTVMNIANGNNESIYHMRTLFNNDLTCIQIDEGFIPPAAPEAFWLLDNWTELSIDCQ